MLNIAIIGAHKVGKTSVFDKVIESLPHEYKIKCLKEIAFDKIEDANTFFRYMKMQEDILTEQVEMLDWADENNVITFSDRSLIDNLAYMIIGKYSPHSYAFPGDIRDNIDELEKLSPIITKALAHFYDYDLLFYIPIEFKIGEPTREQIMYQWSINDVLKHLLLSYGIIYHTLTGSVDERTKTVLDTIRQRMEN